jgi:hypothetical protein
MPVGRDGPPPTPEEAAKAFARWPDDLAGLRTEWSRVKDRWQETDARARALGGDACNTRVADEWSYVETLRHLVFVTDAWVRRAVLGEARPYHREALPPTFLPDLSSLGIDVAAAVTLDEALELRRDAQGVVDRVLGELDEDGLARVCDANPAPGFPPQTTHAVLRCLKVVLNEELAHNQFAARDLAKLEAGR